MADYVVTLTGKDNLSNTVKSVKKELEGVGSSAQKLDKVSAQFDKITKSSMPLNRQVRETSKLLSQMKFDGDFNAAQFLKMAQEAGKAKDAVGDTQRIIKAFADDNFALNSVVQGVQGIAAAGSVATGTMALFGVENEKAVVAIQKVQGALAILNGLQTVSNVLNKDSYVSIARKVIGLKLQAAATNQATAAQTRLNIAVLANPYVAAAAALAALAAAVVYYVSKANEMTEGEKGIKEAMEESAKAMKKGNEAYKNTEIELTQLRATVDKFRGSKEQEKKLVEELNNKYGNSIGKYKDLDSWKKALANTSYYYCKVLQAEARLQALNAAASEAWVAAMAGEDVEKNMAKYRKLQDLANDALDDVMFYKNQLSISQRLNTGYISTSSSNSNTKTATRTSKNSGSQNATTTEKEELGVLGKLNKELKGKQTLLDAENISLAKQQQLLEEIAELQSKIKRIQTARSNATNGTLSSALAPQKLMIEPEIGTKKLETGLGHLKTAYEIALERQQAFTKKAEDFSDVAGVLGSNFSALGNIFKEVGDSATAGMMQLVSVTLQGVSQVIPQVMALIGVKQGEALASGTASAAALPFPANIGAIASITATILATFASILSTVNRFESGGIIGGTSYSGDKLLARVNSGEMVLNKRQQSNLFNAINSGNIGGGTVSTVQFKLRGADIYGSMKNYKAIKSKTGLKGI
jgi:hypothetical protein